MNHADSHYTETEIEIETSLSPSGSGPCGGETVKERRGYDVFDVQ